MSEKQHLKDLATSVAVLSIDSLHSNLHDLGKSVPWGSLRLCPLFSPFSMRLPSGVLIPEFCRPCAGTGVVGDQREEGGENREEDKSRQHCLGPWAV